MSGVLVVDGKEGLRKTAENVKEMKENLESIDVSEFEEISESHRKVVLEPDIETIKNSSLSSIIEDNKATKEIQESKDTSEIKENREGLTNLEKEELQESTGWSNEICDNIELWEEAEIYVKANLKEVEINGKKCLIREDFELDQEDEDGITNRERMERGRPPVTMVGDEVELHHIGQKQSSSLAELTMEQHRGVGNDTILHDKTKETEIDRNEFAKERREHWKGRLELMEGEEK